MQTLFTILFIVAILYCAAGSVLEAFHTSQTDDKFNWKNIFTWPKRFFGK